MSYRGAAALGFVVLLSGPALAACVSVGSQLDCRWPGIALRVGTQTDAAAREAGPALRMQGFAGPARIGRAVPSRDTLAISVQSFSNDPRACARFGNETYCH